MLRNIPAIILGILAYVRYNEQSSLMKVDCGFMVVCGRIVAMALSYHSDRTVLDSTLHPDLLRDLRNKAPKMTPVLHWENRGISKKFHVLGSFWCSGLEAERWSMGDGHPG